MPAPAPPPAPLGFFGSLDDVLQHVQVVKQRRLDRLHFASGVMQRAIQALLRAARAKANAQADMVLHALAVMATLNHEDALLLTQGNAHNVVSKVTTRATVRPYFLRPVNKVLRPSRVDAAGDPLPDVLADPPAFRDPAEVAQYIDTVKDDRLVKLNASQRRVRGAFWAYADARRRRGVAVASGVYGVLSRGLSRASSVAELDKHSARLSLLKAVLPKSELSLRPFLAELTTALPAPGDDRAAVAAGLYLSPAAALASVDDVLKYGDEVYEARLNRLHECQRSIRAAYFAFMRLLKMKADALATLCASRISEMAIAASDKELVRLLDAVDGAARRVPKSIPAIASFTASCARGVQSPVPLPKEGFVSLDSVPAFAQACLDARLQILSASSTKIANTYRHYRYKMHSIGSALGRLAATVLLGFNSAHSDYALDRLLLRLDGTLKRVPNIPDVHTSHLKVLCVCLCSAALPLCAPAAHHALRAGC